MQDKLEHSYAPAGVSTSDAAKSVPSFKSGWPHSSIYR
jgi:hypothetical protein